MSTHLHLAYLSQTTAHFTGQSQVRIWNYWERDWSRVDVIMLCFCVVGHISIKVITFSELTVIFSKLSLKKVLLDLITD